MPDRELFEEIFNETLQEHLSIEFKKMSVYSIKEIKVLDVKKKVWGPFSTKKKTIMVTINEAEYVADTLTGDYDLNVQETIESLTRGRMLTEDYVIEINYV